MDQANVIELHLRREKSLTSFHLRKKENICEREKQIHMKNTANFMREKFKKKMPN